MAAPAPVSSPDPSADRFKAAVQEGLDASDPSRNVSFEAVRKWLLSWGTSDELPPPPHR